MGNYRDSKDHTQLEKFKISHIIAIHDSPRRLLPVGQSDTRSALSNWSLISFISPAGQALSVRHGLRYA